VVYMDAEDLKFERVWHGSRRSHPAIAWPTYLAESVFAILIISMMFLALIAE